VSLGEFSDVVCVSVKDLFPHYPSIMAVFPDEGNQATGPGSAMVVVG
jgi:hypothetical protein